MNEQVEMEMAYQWWDNLEDGKKSMIILVEWRKINM